MRPTRPPRGRRVHTVLALTAAPALILGLTEATSSGSTTAATADGDDHAAVSAKRQNNNVPFVSKTFSTTASAAQRVEDYWTPKRMATAKPALPVVRRGKSGQMKEIKAVADASSFAASVPAGKKKKVRKSKTIGKVFFTTRKGGRRVCSGAAVASKRKNMVFTAGHCLYDKGWVRKWIFVPGYGKKKPNGAGRYRITSAAVLKGWVRRRNFNKDVGIALVRPGRGTKKKLTKNVGGYAPQFNRRYKRRKIAAVGYSEVGFPGHRQKSCRKRTHRRPGTKQVAMKCRKLTPGASGGPWVKGKVVRGKGKINGVNSNVNRARKPTVIRTSYFGKAVRKMYRKYRTRKR